MQNILRFTFTFCALWIGNGCSTTKKEESVSNDQKLATPIEIYGDLLFDVQLEKIFEDGKTFVDAVPEVAPDLILKRYQERKHNPDFNLEEFVLDHFTLPTKETVDKNIIKSSSPKEHISNLWQHLMREGDSVSQGTRIKLPHPYVVPGGRFKEIYYWDSYFTMLGLQSAGKVSLIEGMVENFSYMINEFGFIPNGNRTYYLGRSQPPFFFCMVELLVEERGDEIRKKYLPSLVKEHSFWMSGEEKISNNKRTNKRVVYLDSGYVLNRYWDNYDNPREEMLASDVEVAKKSDLPDKDVYRHLRAGAESGWDFSSRWFSDNQNLSTIETTNIIPVDLNALLYGLELSIAKSYEYVENKEKARSYYDKAELRKKAINTFCWSNENNLYVDYHWVKKNTTSRLSAAAVYPLCMNIASEERAKIVATKIERDFLKPGGIVSTLTNTGQQWDSPNGWAPLQWMTIWGLKNYGFNDLAKEISKRWLSLNQRVFARTGKMMEKYNVIDMNLEAGGGEYELQDGFGWTNGVYLKLSDQ